MLRSVKSHPASHCVTIPQLPGTPSSYLILSLLPKGNCCPDFYSHWAFAFCFVLGFSLFFI